ncbi:MAG: hypothetical protein SGILL_009807, partial [Bacillariaceae sp.]
VAHWSPLGSPPSGSVPPKTSSSPFGSAPPPKSSFSPFGSPPKGKDETKQAPKKPVKTPGAPAFGVAADAKIKLPDAWKSTLATPNTSLRPPPKMKKDITTRSPTQAGFNLSEVNDRLEDEAANMSKDDQIEAKQERDRLADLKKARDRVMSLLTGGNKEDKKEEMPEKPNATTMPSTQGSNTSSSTLQDSAKPLPIVPPPPKLDAKTTEPASNPFTPSFGGPPSQQSTDAKKSFSPFGAKQPAPAGQFKQTANPFGANPFSSATSPSAQENEKTENASPSFAGTNGQKKSFSPFGGAPKTPSSTNQDDPLYPPPSSGSTFEPSRRADFASTPTTPSFETKPAQETFPSRTVPPAQEEPVKAENLSGDEVFPNGEPKEQSFFSSDTVSDAAQAPPRPTRPVRPNSPLSNNVRPNRGMSDTISFSSTPQETFRKPGDVHPGSLSSTLNSGPLPMETPAKPARPFSASTIPLDGRTRLMDLESTRKQAMDQMEGAMVEQLQPPRRRTGSKVPDRAAAAPQGSPSLDQQFPPQQQSQQLSPNQTIQTPARRMQQQQQQPQQAQQSRSRQPLQQQQQAGSSKEKVLSAILAADDNYMPSDFAAEAGMPGALLQEVEGVPLSSYSGEETVYDGAAVTVYAESSLSVPVKVTVPGSIVSYTIERKSSDFWFGVLSQDGSDQVETVKELGPFSGNRNNPVVTDNLLVSAGSTPCTLQFRFDNRNAMNMELGYRIRVIPPPRDTVQEGRKRRSKACLNYLEKDLSQLKSQSNVAELVLTELSQEVESLEQQYEATNKAFREVREQGWRTKMEVEDENTGRPPEEW